MMPAALDARAESSRLLDDLFLRSREHRGSGDFVATFAFLANFRSQRPYNAFLLRVQKPGVKYALTAHQWWDRHHRVPRDGARPLVVLVPYGPVALAYDLEDTDGPDLPPALLEPFAVTGSLDPGAWDCLVANARAARLGVVLAANSWLQAGEARRAGRPAEPGVAGAAAGADALRAPAAGRAGR
ncbi:MAG TPA: hypothetical protein VHN99_04300, partial [Deinococcales bacterium]|nr:hypothetical protein [Deinococcales bacterium]